MGFFVGVWSAWLALPTLQLDPMTAWGQPCGASTIHSKLPQTPTNEQIFLARRKWTAWWFYATALFLPQAAVISTEWQGSASANHTAAALNLTHQATGLISQKLQETRNTVLQNHMALDVPTAAQGSTGAIINSDCCVYSPDVSKNGTRTMTQMKTQIMQME